MVDFLELLEAEYTEIDTNIELVLNFLKENLDDSEYIDTLMEALGDDYDSQEALMEALVKRVNSIGNVTKMLSKKIRTRRASLTTGMSKAKLKLRGRKAARTRKRSPGTVRKAIRKRRKAMRRRKAMGIK